MFKTFWKEEMGQDMAEYSLLLAGMVVAVAGAVIIFKGNIVSIFTSANDSLSSAAASS